MRTSTTHQKRPPRDLRAANRQDSIDAAPAWGQGGTVNIATKFFSPPSKCRIDLFGPVANRTVLKRFMKHHLQNLVCLSPSLCCPAAQLLRPNGCFYRKEVFLKTAGLPESTPASACEAAPPIDNAQQVRRSSGRRAGLCDPPAPPPAGYYSTPAGLGACEIRGQSS